MSSSFEVLFYLVAVLSAKEALCGNINIGPYPESLRFGHATPLQTSGLKGVLAASLGYTTENSLWGGLTVTSAFDYPTAAILFHVPDGGANISLEGTTYVLKEDLDLEDVFDNLHSYIGSKAQRPVHFKSLSVDRLIGSRGSISLPQVQHLDKSESVDDQFIREMTLLPTLAHELKNSSSSSFGGQDIIMVKIDSFEPLVKAYGRDSPQVIEAKKLFHISHAQTVDQLEKFYSGSVLVVTAFTSMDHAVSRRTRSLLQDNSNEALSTLPPLNLNFTVDPTVIAMVEDYFDECEQNDIDMEDCAVQHLNLAAEYSEDYPVIFNIILFLTIIFFVSILAVSMSMATMDPGRDSIIYRMTNPRMKKD